ncbi:CPBP family intramembrane glutamic endopeptidase [Pseudarthrobacter sp. NPDC058196]|uniref:CPBP family intramembrane glutamic endopeptidase n=1 Tax=Pseudarthrobacter sp. NPDC058196 TaxID=3346376 RepID=UPI0036DD6116
MPAPPITSRLVSIAWCILVPFGVLATYLGLGLAVIPMVGEPVMGTAVLGGLVALLVGAARLFRPRWFAHAPAVRPVAGTPHFTRTVLGCLVLAFLAGQSLALWLYTLGGSAGFDESTRARADVGPVVALLLALVAGPVAEEMLFRGLLYPLLRRRVGIVAAVLITATGFSLLHANVVQFAATLPLAVLLALVYERSRVLWPSVLLHLAFNLAAVLVPAQLLGALANPVSALLMTAAFLGCALAVYRMAAPGPVPAQDGQEGGRESEPQAA